MTNVQPDPSAPITQGDFSRFLDMLQSTKEALEAQRRDNLRMQENMITMGRELQELRRQMTPSQHAVLLQMIRPLRTRNALAREGRLNDRRTSIN